MPDIVNVGIAVVDAIGRTIEQVPAPKELVMFDRLVVTTGGCAVNCAVDLAKMGIQNSLIVKVGKDMLGDFVVRESQNQGVNVTRIVRDNAVNTSFSFAMVDSTGERRFVHTMGANATFVAEDLDLDFIATHKYCYIGGTMLMPALDGEPSSAAGARAHLSLTRRVRPSPTVFTPRRSAGCCLSARARPSTPA
jgi:sugar/nucleoside kinase (ribokinase family)